MLKTGFSVELRIKHIRYIIFQFGFQGAPFVLGIANRTILKKLKEFAEKKKTILYLQ